MTIDINLENGISECKKSRHIQDELELTILMPCLNEAKTLGACIQKAMFFLQTEKIQGEILVADNGSSDGSKEIAIQYGARAISVADKGYGAALKKGIKAALGRYVVMGDADGSYDFSTLMPFISKLREGHDLVVGNRFKGGIAKGAMPILNRYLGNPILSFIGQVFFNSPIRDFHCGLRAVRRDAFLQLQLQGDGMEFASEMIVKATLHQFNMIEVPIQLFKDGRSRRSHLRPWRDGWRHLRLLLLFSPRWLFFYPGVVLFNVGLVLLLLLLSGPIVLSQIQFDIHTMLFCSLFMIVGLQAVCFSLFSEFITNNYNRASTNSNYFYQFLKIYTLERGLTLGFLLICSGVMFAIYVFCVWWQHDFGPLEPRYVMRILIPTITLLILGTQLSFASFFMSVLKLHVLKTV